MDHTPSGWTLATRAETLYREGDLSGALQAADQAIQALLPLERAGVAELCEPPAEESPEWVEGMGRYVRLARLLGRLRVMRRGVWRSLHGPPPPGRLAEGAQAQVLELVGRAFAALAERGLVTAGAVSGSPAQAAATLGAEVTRRGAEGCALWHAGALKRLEERGELAVHFQVDSSSLSDCVALGRRVLARLRAEGLRAEWPDDPGEPVWVFAGGPGSPPA